jgi:hypothetical protein
MCQFELFLRRPQQRRNLLLRNLQARRPLSGCDRPPQYVLFTTPRLVIKNKNRNLSTLPITPMQVADVVPQTQTAGGGEPWRTRRLDV